MVLGDILYHGPRNNIPENYEPKEVIQLLNDRKDKILAVRGNCDGEVDQMVLNFPITSDYLMLPFDEYKIFMTHGHLYKEFLWMNENDVVLSGHTHIPVAKKEDGIIFLNPGSISIPKMNHVPSFAILENHTCQICGFHQAYNNTMGKKRWIIEVDHIIEKAQGGGESINNLLVLCPNCHAKKTYGIIKIDENLNVFENGEKIEISNNHIKMNNNIIF